MNKYLTLAAVLVCTLTGTALFAQCANGRCSANVEQNDNYYYNQNGYNNNYNHTYTPRGR